MSNGPTRSASTARWQRRYDAYERLPEAVRSALQQSVVEYDAEAVGKLVAELGERRTITTIAQWDDKMARRCWERARGFPGQHRFKPAVASTYPDVAILRAT